MEFVYSKETEEMLQTIKETKTLYSADGSTYAQARYWELNKLEMRIKELAIPLIMIKKEKKDE